MKRTQRLSLLLLCLIGLLALPGAVLAAPLADRVVADGETISEDINVSDDLEVGVDSIVDADVNILGGNALINGTITGDLLIFGGDVEFGAGAVVAGDCVLIGGEIDRNDAAVSCTQLGNGDFDFNLPNFAFSEFSGLDDAAAEINSEIGRSRGGGLWSALGSTILLSGLAFAVTAIAPRQVERVSEAAAAKPVATGTVGALTFIATISAIIILGVLSALLAIVCIGLLGVPVVLALGALFSLALLLGWVAVGKLIGELLRDNLKLGYPSLPVTAALGTAALSLAVGLIGLLPAVGFSANIASFVIIVIGLGATALTRFGTRSYPLFAVSEPKERLVIDSIPADDDLL